jgi:small subunit ribosomal protein S8
MKDNISDMITRIRNGQKAGLLSIPLFWPTPKFCLKILDLLQQEGFIRGYKKILLNQKIFYFVLLKYTEEQVPTIKKIERISKPGKRVYSSSKNFWKINNGCGLLIISSPKGLLSDNKARIFNQGGEIILYIE